MNRHIAGLCVVLGLSSPTLAQICGSWVLRGAHAPGITARSGVRAEFDSTHNEVMIFGGSPPGGPRDSDAWGWNGTAWTLRAAFGPAVYQHASGADLALGLVYSFGGANDSGTCVTGGFSRWNGSTWTAISAPGPSARLEHSMVFDSARHRLVLFGGAADCAGTLVNGETWEWDGFEWSMRTTTGPTARRSQMMAYDAARGVTVLFGGYNGLGTLHRDTWEWNGQAWTLRSTVGPSGRMAGTMVYDAGVQRTVLFGGFDGESDVADTWCWDGQQWGAVATSGAPPARTGAAMAFDPVRQTIVLFGGGGLSYFNDFWELNLGPCCTADFNGDGDTGTDADIEAFFACLAGNCCTSCGSADFNGDGDTGTDADIEAYFRVLAGGSC